jgi:hypothetical protein
MGFGLPALWELLCRTKQAGHSFAGDGPYDEHSGADTLAEQLKVTVL